MSAFRFKQFTVEQDRCPMKVGTDGVLLGAWTPIRGEDSRLLDIGAGTGLIALMLAQRAPQARIVGLDVDAASVEQARENVARSPWEDRISIQMGAVQEFQAEEPFDLIVSNPPYFDQSLHSPDAGRTCARHTDSLPFEALLEAVDRLLAPEGRFAVVLPVQEGAHFRMLATRTFSLERQLAVRTTPRRGVRRVLMLFSRRGASVPPEVGELIIQTAPETFTPEYRALTADFYLKF